MKMSLPTTRIDTLCSTALNQDDNSQDVLLLDFVPKNGQSSSNIHSNHATSPSEVPLNRYASYAQPFHHQPRPEYRIVNSQSQNNLPNNDLSNFTLVNLSNQHEPEDDQEEVPHNNYKGNHIPLKRNSIQLGRGYAVGNNISSKVSSSLTTSSSDDSDTGFLVPLNNGIKERGMGIDKHYDNRKRSLSNQVGTTGTTSRDIQSPSYPGSPGFQQSHRKKFRRRRTSGARRKSNQLHHSEQNDSFPIFCCFGEDERPQNPNPSSPSLTSKYLRFSCLIVMIIVIITFASIVVSLQRKVDSLNWEVKKLSAAGSSGSSSTTVKSDQDNLNMSPYGIQNLTDKQDQLNASFTSIKTSLNELSERLSKLENQPSVVDVRKDLARLGSDLEGKISELKQDFENLKNSNSKTNEDESKGESKVPPGPDNATASSNGVIQS